MTQQMDGPADTSPRRVLIVGTQDGALEAADALFRHAPRSTPVGVALLEEIAPPATLAGLPVFDSDVRVEDIVREQGIDGALLCAPSVINAEAMTAALRRVGVPVRRMRMIAETLREAPEEMAERSALESLRVMDLPSLAGRAARPIDRALAGRVIRGRRVLITGAGGSIGSELARQAAALGPERIVLVERSENALFEIDREISGAWPGVGRRALLHDVVDAEATRRVVAAERPDVIFHAAAHKHVPMMEDHPAHAVDNNLFGTVSIADAAVAARVGRFVMISTDKAVNPSSVMGATKRLAERYVRSLAGSQRSTRLSMVRFGNVLGSSGSVLQVWARQIDGGGPLTVTDPRMTRYFMTIPEAAALVVESAALSEEESGGADVFVLDMGRPVRILALAERFITACGLTLDGEPVVAVGVTSADAARRLRENRAQGTMPVLITGARPGEKQHEELAHDREELRPTRAAGVLAWVGESVDRDVVREMIEDLSAVRSEPDALRAISAIQRWTPTMPRVETRVGASTNIAGVA